jgi:transposase
VGFKKYMGNDMLCNQNKLIPENYPPWQTVYWYFRKWTLDRTIEIAHQEIRKVVRK